MQRPLLEQAPHASLPRSFDVNLWALLMWTSLVSRGWRARRRSGQHRLHRRDAPVPGHGSANATSRASPPAGAELSPRIRVRDSSWWSHQVCRALWKDHEIRWRTIALGRISRTYETRSRSWFRCRKLITGETMIIDGGLPFGNALGSGPHPALSIDRAGEAPKVRPRTATQLDA